MNGPNARWDAFDAAMRDASRKAAAGDAASAFRSLERAHVLGQTRIGPHLHVHLIPRYTGDQVDPRGGVRWIFPERADYWSARGGEPV